jgi:LacI family transcriptional regulator
MARGLRLKATQIIGLVVPDIGNPFFSRIARCITEVAQTRGFSVLLCDSRDRTDTEADELEVLKARSVEGLVICPVGVSHKHLESLQNLPIPVVMLDRFLPQLNLPAVGCDNIAAARMAVEHLLECGHRGIAYLQGLAGTLPNQDRIEGYRRALESHGLTFDKTLVLGTGFSQESGFEATRLLLAEQPQVTGIFAASNQCALGALRAVAEAGKSVPQDISIVTFDDIDNVEFMSTPVTAVSQPVEAMGRAAAEILFDEISSNARRRGPPVVFSAELIVRDSVRRIDVNATAK